MYILFHSSSPKRMARPKRVSAFRCRSRPSTCQGLRLMSLIFKTQSARGCVNVAEGSLSEAATLLSVRVADVWIRRGGAGHSIGRIVVPSPVPRSSRITKRVSRTTVPRILTIPVPPARSSTKNYPVSNVSFSPFRNPSIPFSFLYDISLINESGDLAGDLLATFHPGISPLSKETLSRFG